MSTKTYAKPDTVALSEVLSPVLGDDTMAEAGRKILLADFVQMLKKEEGARLGEDPEYVHDMRVATRRMRSAFRLVGDYYRTKPTRPFQQQLKALAHGLGDVRDLDVMTADLRLVMESLDETAREDMEKTLDRLEKRLRRARRKLVDYLDSGDYQMFVSTYADFLTSPGKSAVSYEDHEVVPHQVRHVLPQILHERLAAVRAYETVIESADDATMHALRIEFKRLRYAVAYFKDVLGTSGDGFIDELKAIQDHLGRLNDVNVALAQYKAMVEAEALESQPLNDYLDRLESEKVMLREQFPSVWNHFNTRTVQSKLSNALLSLR